MWSQGEAEERLREVKFIMLIGARDRSHRSPLGATRKGQQVVRGQNTGVREVLGEAFIGISEGKAREGEQLI